MSYQYSLNNLRTNSPYYSLNNLNTENGVKNITGVLPVVVSQTGGDATVYLYESSPNVIDFRPKSLKVFNLTATGGTFDSVNATTSIYSAGSLNAPNAFIDCNGINSVGSNPISTTTGFTGPYITAGSGTFQNVNTNTLTANTINITNLNIPNLTFTIATGGYLTSTGTITSRQAFRTTNGINTFDFTDISSDGDTSIYNAGGADKTSFRFEGNERMRLSSVGKLDVSFLQSSGAFTGASVETTGIIKSGGILSTTSGRIANGNSAWTTNSNDYFINANNDTIYLRPKGETATPADAQVYLLNNGNLVCTTGTLTAENIYSNRGANFPNAYVSVYGIDASYQINAPYFTGANGSINNLRANNLIFTTATGGTVKSNLVVKNGQTLQFNQSNDSQIVRIEPGAISNVLSFYDVNNVIQTIYSCTSSGGNIDYLNQLGTRDITNLSRIYNGDGTQALPSYTFVNDTDSGFYRLGSNNMGLSLGNKRVMNLQSSAVSMGSGASNGVDLNLYGTLQVGGTSNSSNSLINLGFSGTLGGSLNSRMGYIYHDGTNITINNQQYNNPPLLQNSTIGGIYISPGNGVYPTIFRPSGKFESYSRVDADACASFLNYTTGAGYGVYINKPNDGVNGNNYYALVIQGNGYKSAITFHPQVSNVVSNLTLGATNYPFSNDAITVRPYSTSSQDIYMLFANHYQESNGKVYIGQNGTGSTRPSDAFIQNWSNNSGNKKSGIYFQTDTSTYGVSCPAQYIDYTGQTFFNPYTNRNSFTPTNTQTGSAFSVNYGFYQLPDVGTSFYTSRGAGKYIPRLKWTLNNANYTVAQGITKIAGATSIQKDHSNYITTAGARQYTFRCDIEGVYDLRWNVNISATASTSWYFYVYKNGAMISQSDGYVDANDLSYCNGTTLEQCNVGDDIDYRIQADTQTITVANESWGMMMYVG